MECGPFCAPPTEETQSWAGADQVSFPVPADYDGDGKTDIAVYQRDLGVWSIRQSSLPPSDPQFNKIDQFLGFGFPQDIPVPADYDGDGKADIALYRDGTWFIRLSSSGAIMTVAVGGGPQDDPVPADYDGDGKADIAIDRGGTWFILRSSDGGMTVVGWGGAPEDIPLN